MILKLSTEEFQASVRRFDKKYVSDWSEWLITDPIARPKKLAQILRKWQACRPNTLRRSSQEIGYTGPFIEDLILQAEDNISALASFDIANQKSFSKETYCNLTHLWNIFEELSYKGNARGGKAGVVGISKAVLLLTDGQVGPAFDSKVVSHLDIKQPSNPKQWCKALRIVNEDIAFFERANEVAFRDAIPEEYVELNNGRIYDMALGPGD